MNDDVFIQKWKTQRERGYIRFVMLFGILVSGVPIGLLLLILLSHNPVIANDNLYKVAAVLIGLSQGISFSSILWWFLNRRYDFILRVRSK